MGVRGKEKKITVKFVPNKVSKPTELNGGKEKLHPLYIRVTFDSTSTRFPYFHSLPLAQTIYISDTNKFYLVSSNEEATTKQLTKEQVESETREYTERLKDVIRYEYNLANNQKYHIKGIFKRFVRYGQKLGDILQKEASFSFRSYLEDHLTYRNFIEMEDYSAKNSWLSPSPLFSDYYFIHMNLSQKVPLTDSIKNMIKSIIYFCLFEESEANKGKETRPFVLFDWVINRSAIEAFKEFLSKSLDPSLIKKTGERDQYFAFVWDQIGDLAKKDTSQTQRIVNELIMNSKALLENQEEMRKE